ncbi:MAG TPA: hypothetical protein VKL61_00840, partial [Candidatus Polarisedimenticolia bacterium]|nr:hypothetical protein [Candidatus Polarisedimenticolia bacterium]
MDLSDRVRAFWRWGTGLATGLLLALGILSLTGRAGALHGEDGVVWRATPSGLEAIQIEPGGPGDEAGIQRGDHLLALEGNRVVHPREIRDFLWKRGGSPILYQVFRAGAVEEKRLVPTSSGEENRLYYYLCVVGLLGLGVGCLLAWKLPSDQSARLLFLVMVSFYLVLVLSPSGIGGTLDWVFYWGDLAGRLLAPALLAHFILRVSEGKGSPSPRLRRVVALYLPGALLLGWNLYLIPFRGLNSFADPAAAVALKDRLEIFYVAAYSAAVAILLLVRLLGALPARARWRVRWLAFSMMAGLLPLSLLYLLPAALGISPGAVGELSILPLALVPLGFAAALLQERTVDLDRSLRLAARSTTGATLVLAGALIISWSASRLMGRESAAGLLTEVILPLTGSGLLALAYRRRIRRLVERILGPPVPDVTRALLEFRMDLNGESGLNALADGFLKLLRRALGLQSAALLVREGNADDYVPVPPGAERSRRQPVVSLDATTAARMARREMVLLDDETVAPRPGGLSCCVASGFRYLFPMTVRGDLKALLLVGTNRDGSPLGSAQLEVLIALASQA